jgi:hypothetical protein
VLNEYMCRGMAEYDAPAVNDQENDDSDREVSQVSAAPSAVTVDLVRVPVDDAKRPAPPSRPGTPRRGSRSTSSGSGSVSAEAAANIELAPLNGAPPLPLEPLNGTGHPHRIGLPPPPPRAERKERPRSGSRRSTRRGPPPPSDLTAIWNGPMPRLYPEARWGQPAPHSTCCGCVCDVNNGCVLCGDKVLASMKRNYAIFSVLVNVFLLAAIGIIWWKFDTLRVTSILDGQLSHCVWVNGSVFYNSSFSGPICTLS